MEKNIKRIICKLSYNDVLFIKQACESVNKKTDLLEKITKLCICEIKEYEKDEISLFGDIVSDKTPSTPKSFLLSIMNLTKEELLFIKKIFEYINNETNSYGIVSYYIDLILNLKKQLVLTTFNHLSSIPNEQIDYYLQLIPKDILRELSDFCETKEPTQKILLNKLNEI